MYQSEPAPHNELPVGWDGAGLRAALGGSAVWVEAHAEALNALNVFPVPDGDTGLNLSSTLRAAADDAQQAPTDALEEVVIAMARGALMGARGNSGVILAQILRGMAGVLRESTVAGPEEVARALRQGADAAYSALEKPVEGTILTVARSAAEGAEAAAQASGSLIEVLEAAEGEARRAVAETPDLLPLLKQANVVDAGGEGYRVFLEGLLFHARGEPIPEGPTPVKAWADLSAWHQEMGDAFGYCTEVLFQGSELDPNAVRRRLSDLGSSVLVVGDSRLLKVHVHTLRPGAVLDLATDLGEIVKVKVDNMELQHRQFVDLAAARSPQTWQPGTSVVAVVSGVGLEGLFRSFGAIVVAGGHTMNPSVEEIAAAVRGAPRRQVIVLPNNRNVTLAAEQAARLQKDRPVAVVATTNVAQGLAAVLALNPEAEGEAGVEALRRAAGRCRCLEISRSVRSASIEGFAINAGALIGFLDGKIVAEAPTLQTLIEKACERMPAGPYEIATIYVGGEGKPEEARALAPWLQDRFAAAAVEVVSGGQPQPDYILALEGQAADASDGDRH